ETLILKLFRPTSLSDTFPRPRLSSSTLRSCHQRHCWLLRLDRLSKGCESLRQRGIGKYITTLTIASPSANAWNPYLSWFAMRCGFACTRTFRSAHSSAEDWIRRLSSP